MLNRAKEYVRSSVFIAACIYNTLLLKMGR